MFEQEMINPLRNAPAGPFHNIIGGEFCAAQNGKQRDVISPLDGQVFAHIPESSTADAERAVASARDAFEDGRWSNLAPASRRKVLLRWADMIEAQALEICVLGVRDNGTNIAMALKAEVSSCVATIRYYAEAIDKIYGEIAPTSPDVLGLIHRQPVGVIGAIVPWNFPLMIGAWKLAPALAAGNSVVLKPPETASLSLMRIAALALEAGLPPGVLNVVTGAGDVVGEAMSLSMGIDALVFTGSGTTGRRIMTNAAASNLKRCYLELGGKSPNVIFADAPDLDEAARVSAAGIFRNAGQVCVAGSRLLVERSVHDQVVEAIARHAQALQPGDPLDLSAQNGAVNNPVQLAQNLAYVDMARGQGATLAFGGAQVRQHSGGWFMEPTLFTGVRPHFNIARDEVFGPILAVTAFDTEAEATALANDSELGLAAAVWTADLSRAHRMVKAIKAGVVHVNTYGGADGTVPLGGVKQSGNGHDKSLHAFDKYLDLKTAWIKL